MTTAVKRRRILDREIALNCPVDQMPKIEQAVAQLISGIAAQNQTDNDIDKVIMAGLQIAYQCIETEIHLKAVQDESMVWSNHFKQRMQYLLEKDS